MASKFATALLAAAIVMSWHESAAASDSALGEGSMRDLEEVKQAAGPARVPTVNDLTKIHADTLVLQAQNALAEETRRMETYSQVTSATAPPPQREMIPVVARVVGKSSEPTAYLLLGDGSVVAAQAGVTIPGGYTVVQVSARQVRVRRNGQTFALGFAAVAPGSAMRPSYSQGLQP